MSILFETFNKEARVAAKALKAAGAKHNITKETLPLYSYLLKKNNTDLFANSKEIVDGILKRPDTNYSISGILDKGLNHIFTVVPQDKINPMKAVREVFAIADNNPAGLSLVENIIDKAKLNSLQFKEMLTNGILLAIEKAKPENIETLNKIMPSLTYKSLNVETINEFLVNNVNMH